MNKSAHPTIGIDIDIDKAPTTPIIPKLPTILTTLTTPKTALLSLISFNIHDP